MKAAAFLYFVFVFVPTKYKRRGTLHQLALPTTAGWVCVSVCNITAPSISLKKHCFYLIFFFFFAFKSIQPLLYRLLNKLDTVPPLPPTETHNVSFHYDQPWQLLLWIRSKGKIDECNGVDVLSKSMLCLFMIIDPEKETELLITTRVYMSWKIM